MRRDYRVTHGFIWTWLSLWVIQSQVHSGSSMIFWTAYVEVHYLSPATNQTMISVCECGVYGSKTPLKQASGFVVLPKLDALACHPNTTFNIKEDPWIALIKRGNCTHAAKIQAAQQQGASAVVIYNLDGTGNGTNTMSHAGTANIVAIMIGNILGRDITDLIESGIEVYMSIAVASQHGPWNPFWIYIMSFIFFGITAIIMGYFTFVVISRFYQNRQLRIQQEVEAEECTCVVCLDSFMRCDVVTTLPCSHIFHKTCIEPWLLEHHTCPMCKYDILKKDAALKPGQESSITLADVRFYPSSVSGLLGNSSGMVRSPEQQGEARLSLNTQTVESAEEQDRGKMDHGYLNTAFEEEQENHQSTNHQTHQV
ncbi:RING finger protein 148 isoform X2 [Tachysurus vachellii]|uniref:RING finger protein 148 isoform X2 n=1 Tax=Tachysurus vachellii TaxID=175792 RepID=UPI00296AA1C6|nr:RING finger protein 148 isoform X2 [Tachysurus vachellii]